MSGAESRYSRVSRRMWRDEKFRALSAPKPCARYLWLFLLTGTHCTAIPGLFSIGEAALAEELGWPVSATRSALEEIERTGMAKVDRGARLVWLPNALAHNPPASPNVVVGWRVPWSELPTCALLTEARDAFRGVLAEMGSEFARSFAIALGEEKPRPSPNPSGGPRPKALVKALAKGDPKPSPSQEQDQDQEQEQEEKHPPTPASGGKPAGRKPRAPKLQAQPELPDPSRPSVNAALTAVEAASAGRFVVPRGAAFDDRLLKPLQLLITGFPDLADWSRVGRWLASWERVDAILSAAWLTKNRDAFAKAEAWERNNSDPQRSGARAIADDDTNGDPAWLIAAQAKYRRDNPLPTGTEGAR